MLQPRTQVVLPITVCTSSSNQNLCALFIFRTLSQHIDDTENERKAGLLTMRQAFL